MAGKRKSKGTSRVRAVPARVREDGRLEADNRPWFDRALETQFWNPEPGSHTLKITGEPRERINNFGNPVVDLPTNLGVFSTGSYAILRPLAQRLKAKGTLVGCILRFTAVGDGPARRYEEVTVS